MSRVSENGILDQQAFEEYRSRSVRAKFLNQMFLGIGGATVFGIVAAATTMLLGALEGVTLATLFTGAYLAPAIGLAALGLVGIFSLYMGARFVAKSIMLDQDFQAKKIGAAARGIEPRLQQGTEMPLPTRTASMLQPSNEQTEQAVVPASWAERFAARRQGLERAWAERAQQSDANPDVTRGA